MNEEVQGKSRAQAVMQPGWSCASCPKRPSAAAPSALRDSALFLLQRIDGEYSRDLAGYSKAVSPSSLCAAQLLLLCAVVLVSDLPVTPRLLSVNRRLTATATATATPPLLGLSTPPNSQHTASRRLNLPVAIS